MQAMQGRMGLTGLARGVFRQSRVSSWTLVGRSTTSSLSLMTTVVAKSITPLILTQLQGPRQGRDDAIDRGVQIEKLSSLNESLTQKRRTAKTVRRSGVRYLSTSSTSSPEHTASTKERSIAIPDALKFLRTPSVASKGGGTEDMKRLERLKWVLVPFATANHICLGSVFAWSLFNQPLMRLNGVVVPSSLDWSLGDVTITFSLIMGGFAWGAVFSKFLDPFGPRLCSLIGAASLGGGFSLAALASEIHSLPLLWLGGGIWGLANGWAYIPPVATLMKWFPSKKGFAAGIVVVGYGSGALIAAPVFQHLLRYYQRAPTYLGPADKVDVTADATGKLFVSTADGIKEVVVATLADVQSTFGGSIDPGVYLVGTGSTGVGEAFLTLGLAYASIMTIAAFSFRTPPVGFAALVAPPKAEEASTVMSKPHRPNAPPVLSVAEATRTKQFAKLYGGFCLASVGAYGLISCSKLILSTSFPTLTSEQLTMFVAGTSIANLTGRLLYSNLSDYFAKQTADTDPFWGRSKVYSIMWGLAAPLGYAGILTSIHSASTNDAAMLTIPEPARLALFCTSIFLVLSSFGGSAATRPAIVSDLFGDKHTAPLTARQLSAVLPSALLGPRLVAYFSDRATRSALTDLVHHVDDEVFENAFGGAPRSNLQSLIDTKTVTIPRVMELCPPGTVDPSPFIFDNALLCAAALTGTAFVLNRITTPLAPRESQQTTISVPSQQSR